MKEWIATVERETYIFQVKILWLWPEKPKILWGDTPACGAGNYVKGGMVEGGGIYECKRKACLPYRSTEWHRTLSDRQHMPGFSRAIKVRRYVSIKDLSRTDSYLKLLLDQNVDTYWFAQKIRRIRPPLGISKYLPTRATAILTYFTKFMRSSLKKKGLKVWKRLWGKRKCFFFQILEVRRDLEKMWSIISGERGIGKIVGTFLITPPYRVNTCANVRLEETRCTPTITLCICVWQSYTCLWRIAHMFVQSVRMVKGADGEREKFDVYFAFEIGFSRVSKSHRRLSIACPVCTLGQRRVHRSYSAAGPYSSPLYKHVMWIVMLEGSRVPTRVFLLLQSRTRA